jgi:hypothetical protein
VSDAATAQTGARRASGRRILRSRGGNLIKSIVKYGNASSSVGERGDPDFVVSEDPLARLT